MSILVNGGKIWQPGQQDIPAVTLFKRKNQLVRKMFLLEALLFTISIPTAVIFFIVSLLQFFSSNASYSQYGFLSIFLLDVSHGSYWGIGAGLSLVAGFILYLRRHGLLNNHMLKAIKVYFDKDSLAFVFLVSLGCVGLISTSFFINSFDLSDKRAELIQSWTKRETGVTISLLDSKNILEKAMETQISDEDERPLAKLNVDEKELSFTIDKNSKFNLLLDVERTNLKDKK